MSDSLTQSIHDTDTSFAEHAPRFTWSAYHLHLHAGCSLDCCWLLSFLQAQAKGITENVV